MPQNTSVGGRKVLGFQQPSHLHSPHGLFYLHLVCAGRPSSVRRRRGWVGHSCVDVQDGECEYSSRNSVIEPQVFGLLLRFLGMRASSEELLSFMSMCKSLFIKVSPRGINRFISVLLCTLQLNVTTTSSRNTGTLCLSTMPIRWGTDYLSAIWQAPYQYSQMDNPQIQYWPNSITASSHVLWTSAGVFQAALLNGTDSNWGCSNHT